VTIHELDLLEVMGTAARMRVRCSKGTYVRTLAEDLGQAMDSCAHLTALRRISVAPFPPGQLITLEDVETGTRGIPLLPADAALPQLAPLPLDKPQMSKVRHGQPIVLSSGTLPPPGLVRLYGPDRRFLGIGQLGAGGELKPVRLFNDLGPIPT